MPVHHFFTAALPLLYTIFYNSNISMSTTEDYSALAAESAKHSLKRTRELFDRSATAAFLPTAAGDVRLYEASQARRLVTQYQQQSLSQKKNKTSDALVVSTVREEEEEEQEIGGGALVQKDETKPNKQTQKTSGILVVRTLLGTPHVCSQRLYMFVHIVFIHSIHTEIKHGQKCRDSDTDMACSVETFDSAVESSWLGS